MLFVAEYEFGWDTLSAVIAKRIEWGEALPEGFRFVGEWVWANGEPAFRGVAVVEAESVEALDAFVLHYGPTLTMRIHPATDVATGIATLARQTGTRKAQGGRRKR
jgi:hypothetical protein